MNQKFFKHHQNKAESILSLARNVTDRTDNSGRVYLVEGEAYPSVTTVTGFEKSKFFAEWRRKNPKEAKRVTQRGTKLHAVIESYLNNNLDSEAIPFDIMDLFLVLKDEIDKIDNICVQELPLWSKTMKLAGRVDCIAEYDGQLSIIDFKGSTKLKKKEEIDNYFMQATAYAIMWQELTGERVDKIVILIATETGEAQVFVESPLKYVKSLYQTIQNYRASHGSDSTNS